MAEGEPSGFATSVKAIADAVRSNFGAAVVIIIFLGVTLVSLAVRSSGDDGAIHPTRLWLMVGIILAMLAVLAAILLLRTFKPTSLSGPLVGDVEDLRTRQSTMERIDDPARVLTTKGSRQTDVDTPEPPPAAGRPQKPTEPA